ncbi:MAG: hypothetical protein ABSD74_13960 [Rhizomicrobium sp.]|jgi:hypothetical protein
MNALPAVRNIDPGDDIEDSDRDALHILPIAILPVEHAALRRARMVKNPRLDTMVEFFHLAEGTSGQTTVEGAGKRLGLNDQPHHPDLVLLRKIAVLPSFDVYSLRILLRRCGVSPTVSSALKLSDKKIASLSAYMSAFTQPLVNEIFGEDASVGGFTDIVGLMRNCPADTARERLAQMARKLGIGIHDIPNFLEDYADIFMSLSYYRQCLDQILPPIQTFLESAQDIRSNYNLKHDVNTMRTIDFVEQTLNALTANVTGRLESFERSTNDMWHNLSAERFRRIETLIKNYHISIGGVLCALSVKMNAWRRQFPSPGASSPMRRAEFIMSEMRQGIDRIRAIEESAPMLSELREQ